MWLALVGRDLFLLADGYAGVPCAIANVLAAAWGCGGHHGGSAVACLCVQWCYTTVLPLYNLLYRILLYRRCKGRYTTYTADTHGPGSPASYTAYTVYSTYTVYSLYSIQHYTPPLWIFARIRLSYGRGRPGTRGRTVSGLSIEYYRNKGYQWIELNE